MADPPASPHTKNETTLRYAWLGRLVPAALLTCVAAVYNGFPLTYPDTGNYLENALAIAHGRAPWFFYRPLMYGAFLIPFGTPQTIWLVPVAQGLLVAWVVDRTLSTIAMPLSSRGLLTLFAGLSAFTTLPWISGQIMPDVFTGLMILLCFGSVWGRELQTPVERCAVGALLTLAIACHLSHFPLYAVLMATTLLGRLLVDRTSPWRRHLPVILGSVAPLVAAAGIVIGSNYYFHRKLVLSRSSSLFALAHLAGEGLAQRYLARACPTRRYLICSEQSSLRPDVDWFMWDSAGPWKRHEPEVQRGDSTFLREAPAIVAGTLRQEWPAAVRASLSDMIAQLGTFGMHPGELAFSGTVANALRRLGPGTLRAYTASRQVRSSLPIDAVNLVQDSVFGLGVLVLLGCWRSLRGRAHAPVRALIAVVCLGLVFNALLVAGLATVHPRYQSRVVWLVPLTAVLAALQTTRARRAALGSAAARAELS
jgi:hypothetical protein